MENVDDSLPDDCSCKVGRASRTYGLGDLDRRLRRRRAEGASLRDLERVVNEAILRSALRSASAEVVGDVAGIYDALTGSDASAGERTEARERLSAAGVDVDAVEADFVSYGTVRSHLRECLDVDTGRETSLSVEDGTGTIEWARARSEGIVERTLDRLADQDRIAAGDLDVTHVVRVSCTNCGRTEPVDTFLANEGCDCDGESASNGSSPSRGSPPSDTDRTSRTGPPPDDDSAPDGDRPR